MPAGCTPASSSPTSRPVRPSVVAPDSWTVVSNAPVAQTAAAGPGLKQTRFAETLPISTYLTALVAGDYHTLPGPPSGMRPEHPDRDLLPEVGRGQLDAQRSSPITGRLRGLRTQFGVALPVRQVRPGLRAGVQRRRDGERRLRHPARRVPVPQQGHRRLAATTARHDPARAVAHVVRRPGDHALVGRPLAEGVLRHLVGYLRRRGAGRRS